MPDLGIPLSGLFDAIETERARLHIAEYSLSQTSLESIFNSMAAQQDEEKGSVRGMAGAGAGGDAPAGAAGGVGPIVEDVEAGSTPTSTPRPINGGYARLDGGGGGRGGSISPTDASGAGGAARKTSTLSNLSRVLGAGERPTSLPGVEFASLGGSTGVPGASGRR